MANEVMLNLTIERKWFDMIVDHVKHEEYRELDNPQCARLFNMHGNDHDFWRRKAVVILRNGYRMDSPTVAKCITYLAQRNRDSVRHPEWGEPRWRKRHHLVIGLGNEVARGTYAEVIEILGVKTKEEQTYD